MYDPKDIQFAGKHDFDKNNYWANSPALTFSVGVFQWQLKNSGKSMKKGKVKVRVKGYTHNPEAVYKEAERIVSLLDKGQYDGPKSVTVK